MLKFQGVNQFEALVRRLPTAKPLMNVPGFNEYGKLNYMCGLHILVWTFFCAFVSMVLGLVVLIVGVFPMKDPRQSKRFFVIICITAEMIICLVPSTFCMVSFFVRQRILLLGYTLGQLFSGVGMIVVVIILGNTAISQSANCKPWRDRVTWKKGPAPTKKYPER
uniref:Uncharacterized protein n=1 Tax=Romanomermis culicivorax TaxID=13658 RepID=A0A915IHK6_ROMCU